jgi:hypothetical protein
MVIGSELQEIIGGYSLLVSFLIDSKSFIVCKTAVLRFTYSNETKFGLSYDFISIHCPVADG